MNLRFLTLLIALLLVTHFGLAQQTPVFPLKISENRRYFVDQAGKPFLYNADTGWQITYKLTYEEAKEYMLARKEQGFNALQIQLAMQVNARNRYGDYIFDNDNDFSKPNEKYHNHVLRLIKLADSLHLFVALSQPWLGCCEEAFGNRPDKPIQKNGPAKNRIYGKYLGKKFASCQNLFWIIGGDNDPKNDYEGIVALAEGLRETAPKHQLLTYHASPTHSSTDIFQYAPWLGFSMVYTYWRDKVRVWINPEQMLEVYEMSLREYNKSYRMPFILGEAQYEGFQGNDDGTPDIVRRQAYWTILCGGTGHAYGSTIWSFPPNWREILKYSGAGQLGHFYNLFTRLPWWQLVPDQRHAFVVAGYGDYGRLNYVTTAVTDDKKVAVSYFTRRQTIAADLSKLSGKKTTAQWYNPRTGQYTDAGTHEAKLVQFTPPTNEDWALVFASE